MQATLEGLQNITRSKTLSCFAWGNSRTRWVSSNFKAYALGTTILNLEKAM